MQSHSFRRGSTTVLAARLIPVRGVYRAASLRPGYVILTVVDSQGQTLEYSVMLAEWCDDAYMEAAYARLARSDPDYQHRPLATLTPVADACVLPFVRPACPVPVPHRALDVVGVGA